MNDQQIEACARAAHEANRAYCIAIGDLSQPNWDDAPAWQRSSASNGVRGVIAGNTPIAANDAVDDAIIGALDDAAKYAGKPDMIWIDGERVK